MDHVNGEGDFDQKKSSAKVVVFDFTATWCGPCRILTPILEELSGEYEDHQVKFYKVDVDENRAVAQKFNISAVPSIAIFKDGEMHGGLIIGVRSKTAYQDAIKELLE